MKIVCSKVVFFVCLLLLGINNQAQASRAVGGELTYTYNPVLGQYEVLVVIYYNCAAKSVILNNYTVRYQSQSSGKFGTLIVGKTKEELINTTCKGVKNTCEGGKAFGFKKISYSGLFKPDTVCKDWILSWVECNRNYEITTINNPDTKCLYLEALLNNLDAPGNSSPQFSASPVSLLCQGETRTINYNVFDSNNRIELSLIAPKISHDSSVTYKPGFSASNPLSSNPALSLAQNGNIKITPTTSGEQAILAILVKEYDQNNNLISSAIRDAQMIVIDCNNKLPQLSGFDGTNNYGDVSSLACANHQECFYLRGTDPDAKDKNVYFSFIQPLPNMFVHDPDYSISKAFQPGGNPSKVGICWTPTDADIGIKKFLVSVTDSACPIMGTQTFLYTITVNPGMFTDFPFLYKKIKCDTMVELIPTVYGGIPPYSYAWSTGERSANIIRGPGKYNLTVTDAKGCTDAQTVELDGQMNVDFSYEKACASNITRFYDTSSAVGGITAREWDFGDGTTGSGKYPTHIYNTTGNFIITLTTRDNLGCGISTQKAIQICNPARYKIDIPIDTFVIKQPDTSKCRIYTLVKLKQINEGDENCAYPDNVKWLWGNGRTSSGFNLQRFIYDVAGVYTITAFVSTKICISDTLFSAVTILGSPDAFLNSGDYYQRCDAGQSKLIVASVTSTDFAPYNFIWSSGTIDHETATTSGYNISATGFYTVTVTNSLMAKNIMCFESKKGLYPEFAPQDFCLKTSVISMENNSVSPFGISVSGWDFGDGATNFTNVYNPSHNYIPDSSFTATLFSIDNAGCKDTTKQSIITFLPQDTLKVISSKLSCFSEKIEFRLPRGKSIDMYRWNFGLEEGYNFTTDGIAFPEKINQFDKYINAQVGNPPLDIDKRFTIDIQKGYYLPKYPGKKNISLEVTYNGSCKKNYFDTAHVFKQLKVDAEIGGQRCAGKVVSFTGRVFKSGDYPIKDWWLSVFRDPTRNKPPFVDTTKTGLPFSFTGQSFNFTFQEEDYNLLRVKVADANPLHVCFADTTLDSYIVNIISPNFNFANSCINTQITLLNQRPGGLYGTDLLIVDYGDDSVSYYPGGIDVASSFSHTYADTGLYFVKLKVLDSTYFCADSLTKAHTVYGAPHPDFSYDLSCELHKTIFENKSIPTKNINPIVKTTWIVETDTIHNKSEPISHTFGVEGTYTIKLSVEDTLGCIKDTVREITVFPTPKADFSFDKEQALAFREIRFFDKSIAGNSSSFISSWLWNFGDGDGSNVQNPVHTYGDVKIFKANLLVTNQFGCVDDTTYEVDLNPYLILPTAFSPNGDNVNDKLFLVSKGIKSIDNFKIYNRYGELVFEVNEPNFESNDHTIGWDGSFNGIKQPAGVYQYYVTGRSVYNKEMKPLHGNLILLY